MAILKNGIHGPFSGRVGNIVGYELNGQHIIRALPAYPKRRKVSELVLLNRARMSAVSKFLQPLQRVLSFGYKNIAPKGSRVGPFQAAQSHTFKNAIAYGEGNVPYVNPEKVLVFRGDLPSPDGLEFVLEGSTLRFSWIKGRQLYGVFVAVVYVEGNYGFILDGLANAKDGEAQWQFPGGTVDKPPIHIYGGFYDLIGDELSESVYAGSIL